MSAIPQRSEAAAPLPLARTDAAVMEGTAAEARKPSAIKIGIALIAVLAGAAAFWLARDVLLLGFLGLLIAVVFSFPVGWLSKVMPRGAAVCVVLALLVGIAVLIGWLAADQISEQIEQLKQSVPKALKSARQWLEKAQAEVGGGGRGQQQPQQQQRVGAEQAATAAAQVGQK